MKMFLSYSCDRATTGIPSSHGQPLSDNRGSGMYWNMNTNDVVYILQHAQGTTATHITTDEALLIPHLDALTQDEAAHMINIKTPAIHNKKPSRDAVGSF